MQPEQGKNLKAKTGNSWHNWVLMLSITLVSTVGLAIAVIPAVSHRVESPYPWMNTEVVLLVSFAVAVSCFLVYLTWQQFKVRNLYGAVQALEEDRQARVHQHYDRLMALLQVSRIMGEKSEPKAVFDAITDTCLDVFDCERVSLMLLDPEVRELVVQSARGEFANGSIVGERMRLGQGIAGWVAEQGEAMVIDQAKLEDITPGKRRNGGPSQAMVVPIFVREELVGVLNVSSSKPQKHYGDEDLKALQVFGENAGACIRHAQQATWLRNTIANLQKQLDAGVGSTP